tara:strand:- start:556 stop:765 length:210 start_codon:yes stop_codon:yes gene_type:complete
MFGNSFLLTALVTFTIIMITVKLGMFDSVLKRYGTRPSIQTKAWALFLTIISVSIIMGLGLLVEFVLTP